MSDTRMSYLQRSLGAGRLTRRTLLLRAGALGLSLPTMSALLAACGGSSTAATSTTASGASKPTATATGVTINGNITPTPTTAAAAGGSPTIASPVAAATTAATGKAGGTVTFARQQDSTLLDPPGNILNTDIWIFQSIYDRLITVDNKGTGLLPSLAEKWEISTDGTTFTFHIRKGVKFSDGSDFSNDDIIFTLDRSKNKQDSPWKFSLDQVKSVTATDASTIVITLTQVWAPFLSDLSLFSNNILSKAFVAKVGEAALAQQTMGTGPYALKEWKLGESLTLVKNQHYWEAGLPLVDEIKFLVIPNGTNEILQMQGGSIDGIIGQSDVPFNRVSDLQKDANLQVVKFLSTYNNFIVLNCRNPPLDDVKVRQALNFATDKQALIDTILFGTGEISNGYMPNGALYWDPDVKPYEYDVAKATDLLKSSNTPGGFNLAMQIQSGNQISLQLATALKDMWSKINVNLDIQQLDSAVLNDNYNAVWLKDSPTVKYDPKAFECQPSGWTHDIIDPDEIVSLAILPDSQGSWATGWVNQKAFDLAQQGRATLVDAERRKIYYQIQQIHRDDAPLVFLYVIPYVDVLSKKIQGFFHHPMGQYDFRHMSKEG